MTSSTDTSAAAVMQESCRYLCYSLLLRDAGKSHIVTDMPDDDHCPVCGGEDWGIFPVVECTRCGEWAASEDAEIFRATHGCFGESSTAAARDGRVGEAGER